MSRLRIVVLGYIVRGPLGGMAWHHLQYVVGLRRLGHDVLFLEDSDDYEACYDPTNPNGMTKDYRYGAGFAREAFNRLGMPDAWAYYDRHTDAWIGPAANRAEQFCGEADVLLNISAINPLRTWTRKIPVRVLIDTDPAFTQVRFLKDAAARALAREHTHFLSFGESVGQPDCHMPDDGFSWQPTRQPVVLDLWPVTPIPSQGKFTTVMSWDSYASREWNGLRLGMKSESFGPYMELPKAIPGVLEVALGGESAPRPLLESIGWSLRDSVGLTRDPWTYQDYLKQSLGEFTIAKHGYVVSNCGWFSERSAAYLALGRPVITQETGYSRWYPTGQGLLTFRNPGEAIEAIQRVQADLPTHAQAARKIAQECFDAGTVLRDLLHRIGV